MHGHYLFRASRSTYDECIRLGLFGSVENQYVTWVKNIIAGDFIFLLCRDLDFVEGPFIATSNGNLNINASAWQGRFPAQISIKRTKDTIRISYDEFCSIIPAGNTGWHNPTLTINQGNTLMQHFLHEEANETEQCPIFIDPCYNDENTIFYLGKYHPYHGGKNPLFDDYSSKILALKKGNNKEINFFFNKLNPILRQGIVITSVPSSSPLKEMPGIRILAKKLADYGRIDSTASLIRHKEIISMHNGGDRSITTHLSSIKVSCNNLIINQNILLLDDVSTTGNSLIACKQLLMDKGAKCVKLTALGHTTAMYLNDLSSYENIEIL